MGSEVRRAYTNRIVIRIRNRYAFCECESVGETNEKKRIDVECQFTDVPTIYLHAVVRNMNNRIRATNVAVISSHRDLWQTNKMRNEHWHHHQ